MNSNELEIISGFLKRANCPEEVFGKLSVAKRDDDFKHSYKKLAKSLHPDFYRGDPAAEKLAIELFKLLEQMKAEALQAIKKGLYGKHERFSWKIPVLVGKYVVETPLTAGDIADFYTASMESSVKRSNYLLKIARSPNDNDLLSAEKNVLEKIRAKMKSHNSKDWPQTIPEIYESFLMDDGKRKRRVNVMKPFDGFYTAKEIRERTPEGLDGRTIAWMWKRLLVLLEWVNKAGFVHGAVLPPHVMFYPDNDGFSTRDIRKHSIRLVDWCYAVDFKNRTRLSAWIPEYKDFYAPEILGKTKLGGYTDLYMGAQTMMYLLGNTPGSKKFDVKAPAKILDSINRCRRPKPEDRPQSIGKYFDEFSEILKKEYGSPKYHDFVLSGI
jgi:serine/threonine protein kinase